nr:hypothetical protein [uncultured Dialister sp.]
MEGSESLFPGKENAGPEEKHAEEALHPAHVGEIQTGGIGDFYKGGQDPIAGTGCKDNTSINSLRHNCIPPKRKAQYL